MNTFYARTINVIAIILLMPYIFIAIQALIADNDLQIFTYLVSSETKLLQLLQNTMYICFSSSLFALLIAIPLAWFLFRTNMYLKKFCQFFVLVAVAIPTHIHISTWLGILGENGLLTPYIQYFFPDFGIYNLHGCIWITGWSYAPIATAVCGYIFLSIDEHVEMEARLYLSNVKVFFTVIVPMVKKSFFFLWIFLSFLVFGDVSVTDILGIQNTLPQKIYLLFNIYYEPELALYLSIPTLCVLIIPFGFVLFVGRKNIWKNRNFSLKKEPYILENTRFLITITSIILIFIFWLPVPILIYITQTFHKFINIFYSVKSEIVQSLFICIPTATLICFFALLCSWRLARSQNNWLLIIVLVWLVFVPSPLTGIAIMRISNKLLTIPFVSSIFIPINNTPFWLIITLFSKFLPLAILLLYSALQQIPKKWEEMAMLDGYKETTSFWIATFPLIIPNLILTYIAVFIFCLGESIISTLIIPPGTTTLSVRILTLLHNGARADVCAASLWFLIIMIVICILGKIANRHYISRF